MKIFFTSAFVVLYGVCGFCQNLAPNPDFEQDTCSAWGFSNVSGWFQKFSADFFHTNCPASFESIEYKQPQSGRGFVGLYVAGQNTFQGTTYAVREYIVGKLVSPMQAGKKYHVAFYAKPSGTIFDPEMMSTTANISAAFIQDTSVLTALRFAAPDFGYALPEHLTNHSGLITDMVNYTLIEGCYTATGGEKYVVIGNFRNESTTEKGPLSNATTYDQAYFLVDNIRVAPESDMAPFTDTLLCKHETLFVTPDTAQFREIHVNGSVMDYPIQINQPGYYNLSALQGACQVEDVFYADFKECLNCQFYIPSAFSPNSDGINDEISIASDCDFTIANAQIFDRWGALVFHSQTNFNWNGSFKGKAPAKGVYVYKVDVKIPLPQGTTHQTIIGHFTIL